MTDSEILRALIDCEIAMTAKGWPSARATISCERTFWKTDRPWMVALYLNDHSARPEFVGNYADGMTAILALSNAVEDVEPRPRDWTREEIAATLGIAPDYAEAAE